MATKQAYGMMAQFGNKLLPLPGIHQVSASKTIIIQPNEWVNKIYTLSDPMITENSNQEFIAPIYTSDQQAMFDAIMAADIKDGGQANGQAKLICAGTVPTVPITLRVIFRGNI